MKLDLSEIVGNVGKHHRYTIDEPGFESEEAGLKCTEPIKGSVEFRNTGRHLVLRGEVGTRVQMDCSRCLRFFEIPVNVRIEDEFLIPLPHSLSEEDGEDEEEIEVESILKEGIFDLSEFLRQTIIVSLPIKPLCEDVCKGICPTCGTNLNEGPCDCPVEAGTSPFAALQELLENGEAGKGQ
jgi:uncharacterized protein